MHLSITTLVLGVYGTNVYIVRSGDEVMVVDPACDARRIMDAVKRTGCKLSAIVCTHSHDDHIGAAYKLRALTGAKVMSSKEDAPLIEDPWFEGEKLDIPGCPVDRMLKEGDRIAVGLTSWRVIRTPGHTPGGISLFCEDTGDGTPMLFSGDTLFKGSIGRTDFEGGSPSDMRKSLAKIAKLPGRTVVLPGHGPKTSIDRERKTLGWYGGV